MLLKVSILLKLIYAKLKLNYANFFCSSISLESETQSDEGGTEHQRFEFITKGSKRGKDIVVDKRGYTLTYQPSRNVCTNLTRFYL